MTCPPIVENPGFDLPLDGIRVLDLSNVLAGPYASYQLALLGADVIKVEVPGRGDLARQLGSSPELSAELMGISFLAQNAGKRSVTLNLKEERGKEVFRRLLAEADVLLENFRPGVLAQLGFPWGELKRINARLVYCAISGFGQSGPMRERPAYDQIIQGLSGMASVTGSAETAPLRAGYPVCDTLGGLAAAMAISAALTGRTRTGRGRFLDVSMLDTSITAMGWVVSDYLIGGRTPVPLGNENRTAAPSGTFDTGDGRLNIAANKQEQFEALCRIIGRDDLTTDPRFAEREARKVHRDKLRAEIESVLTSCSSAEWEELLSVAGVPAGQVLEVPQSVELEQVRNRELLHEVHLSASDPRTVEVVGSGVHVDERPLVPRSAPPLLGEHTDAVLTELGYSPEEIDSLRRAGVL